MGIFAGGAPFFGNGSERCCEINGIIDQSLAEVGADGGDVIEEGLGKEAGRFRDGKVDMRTSDDVEAAEHRAEGFGTEAAIEVLTQFRNHKTRVMRGGRRGQFGPRTGERLPGLELSSHRPEMGARKEGFGASGSEYVVTSNQGVSGRSTQEKCQRVRRHFGIQRNWRSA